MRETNIWVLIADEETARICSTREGAVMSLSDDDTPAAVSRGEDKVLRAWHGNNRWCGFQTSARRRFANHIAQVLMEAGREGAYDGLIVVAAPEIANDLNRALAPETCARLIGGIIRDMPSAASADLDGAYELRN